MNKLLRSLPVRGAACTCRALAIPALLTCLMPPAFGQSLRNTASGRINLSGLGCSPVVRERVLVSNGLWFDAMDLICPPSNGVARGEVEIAAGAELVSLRLSTSVRQFGGSTIAWIEDTIVIAPSVPRVHVTAVGQVSSTSWSPFCSATLTDMSGPTTVLDLAAGLGVSRTTVPGQPYLQISMVASAGTGSPPDHAQAAVFVTLDGPRSIAYTPSPAGVVVEADGGAAHPAGFSLHMYPQAAGAVSFSSDVYPIADVASHLDPAELAALHFTSPLDGIFMRWDLRDFGAGYAGPSATLIVGYPEILAPGVAEESLALFRFDGATWSRMPGFVDVENDQVIATVPDAPGPIALGMQTGADLRPPLSLSLPDGLKVGDRAGIRLRGLPGLTAVAFLSPTGGYAPVLPTATFLLGSAIVSAGSSALDASGRADSGLTVPNSPTLVGSVFYWQSFGIDLSNPVIHASAATRIVVR